MFESSKDPSTEVIVNLMASLTRSNQAEAARSLIQKHKSEFAESYDLVYNSACALIEGGDLSGAEEQLKLAESQCRKALEGSEGGVDELNAELAPIMTQLAYVKQRRGEDVAATLMYEKVLAMDISDLAVIAVCNNNLVSLRGAEGHATSIARLTNLAKTQTQDKLSTTQKRIVLYNRCILLLQAGKFDDLSKLVKTLDPTSEATTLIQAATLIKKGQTNKAIETLREFVRATLRDAPSSSTSALRVQLSLAQIQLNQGNMKETIAILKSITSIQQEPAYLSTLVILYQKIGELGSALSLLDETASKLMTNKKTMDVAQVTTILRKSADLKLANSMFSQATETLSKILDLNPGDVRIQATLALALASVDPGRAEQFLKDLPKVTPSQNAEVLETMPTPMLRRAVPVAVSAAAHATAMNAGAAPTAAAANAAAAAKASAQANKKKRKRRKNKPATKATPGQPADPERWIPRPLRKGLKRRGAPATKPGHAQGHQGAATNEALNKANTAAPSKAAPSNAKAPPRSAAAKKRPGGRRR
jgi:signal recognition particle subunit SRP72